MHKIPQAFSCSDDGLPLIGTRYSPHSLFDVVLCYQVSRDMFSLIFIKIMVIYIKMPEQFFFFYQRTEINSKQTMRFHPRKIICLGRFLITLLFLTVSVVFLNILSLIFTYLHILSQFSVLDIFA